MKKLFYLLPFILIAFTSCHKDKSKSEVIFTDPLTVQKNQWTVGSSDNYAFKFSGGHYSISVDTAGIFVYTLAPSISLDYPYSVEVDAIINLTDISKVGNVGLIFNYVDKLNYSVVDIYNVGAYDIWQLKSGQPTEIVKTASITGLNFMPTSQNTIKIIQTSDKVELQINNVSITTANLSLPSSSFGVGILTGTVTDPYYTPVTGNFNNFTLTKL